MLTGDDRVAHTTEWMRLRLATLYNAENLLGEKEELGEYLFQGERCGVDVHRFEVDSRGKPSIRSHGTRGVHLWRGEG